MMTTADSHGRRGPPERSNTGLSSDLRGRNKRRDDAIRKKVEQELSRKTNRRSHTGPTPRRPKAGTVSSLRPAPAIIILETARIVQAAQLMAAKRADAVLCVNEEGSLVGILTDKDIAYRVVAEGLEIRTTLVSSIMTKNPTTANDNDSRNDALNTMVSRRFRHLPVTSNGTDEDDLDDESAPGPGTAVVGLLDITKCVFERLDDLERKVNEDQTIITAMEALERRGTVGSEHVGQIRQQHGCPDVGTVLAQMEQEHHDEVPEVNIRATVRDAARVMRARHQTAVLVAGDVSDDRIGGIFTTKDIVLRVIAAQLDPATTSVVRVMTPHPDSVTVDTSILDALKKLHAGHYLHLPVTDGRNPVGLVDVLTLTVSMLTYLASKDGNTDATAESGPMWNKFWNSTFAANSNSLHESESDRHSAVSDSHASGISHQYHAGPQPVPPISPHSAFPTPSRTESVRGGEDLMSAIGGPSGPSLYSRLDEGNYAFKLKDTRNNKVFRFSSRPDSITALFDQVRQKTGVALADEEIRVSYVDDEGDVVHLSADRDLEEAVSMARRAGWSRLMLYVGEPPNSNLGAVDEESPAVSGRASPALRKAEAVEEAPAQQMQVATFDPLRTEGRVVVSEQKKAPGVEVMDFLREAPLPVNVAISAGIVLIAGVIFMRLAN
ncbi:hypothetical protein HK097_006292 [Rhizophlyctis rosea]|uniref:CBS-domain-containing protein n=1 Tax=Rhizophlyctis rosea TaxID=64517 RepID=A0AAD5SFT0_9FUNG|nr:hypothetical protein HK097_006292 [Rhizophlyctis rosea]